MQVGTVIVLKRRAHLVLKDLIDDVYTLEDGQSMLSGQSSIIASNEVALVAHPVANFQDNLQYGKVRGTREHCKPSESVLSGISMVDI